MNKEVLLQNIDKVHTTEMGIDRIKKNLKLDTNNVVDFCKSKVLDKKCNIYKQGKNWYCEIIMIEIRKKISSLFRCSEFSNFTSKIINEIVV